MILTGDALAELKKLDSGIVQTCITSPPYWGLRSYLPDGVRLKEDAPTWVRDELIKRGVFPDEK